jgi:hypothetical protein
MPIFFRWFLTVWAERGWLMMVERDFAMAVAVSAFLELMRWVA